MNATQKVIRTTCPYCGTGCGVKALVSPTGAIEICGDDEHPANFGRLCVKGAALAETLTEEGRLLHPKVNGARADWETALRLVADRFRETIAAHGPDAVAFYVSGQMLTEDYYVANRLMKGFIGSANIDTNSRLCMASSVAGHKRAFGADVVPNVYEDLETADLVLLVGSNLAWCHPVLYQRLEAAKARRPDLRIIDIDPRRTATSELCDAHLALAPGSDVALFLGLLTYLDRVGACDHDYVARHTSGVETALAAAKPWSIGDVARATGVVASEIEALYALFATRERVVTVYSQGVNQSVHGTDKVNAILNCHLFTGRIGKPGSGPFSVTGQPNAMGGREVGGLANQLACHMELDDPHHRAIVQSHWRAPTIADRPGLKAVEMFDAVRDGRVRAIWIIGANPAVSLPQADVVRAALAACPFVVVSDAMEHTDTTALASVVLPAQAWSEKDGTVTNSERRISRQRALRKGVGESLPDWRIICRVATLMGFEGFDYQTPADIFREYAALSGRLNHGARDFDISVHEEATQADYDRLAPFQWPSRKGARKSSEAKRFFGRGGFFTPDRRARLVATPYVAPAPHEQHTPFVLNTGRIRDQWHTMTRTGVSPRLSRHIAEPFVEIHPADAEALRIAPASLVRLSNARGAVVLRALVTERQRRGAVFAPFHWTGLLASAARVDALVGAATDPVSGQPGLKEARVTVVPFPAQWFAFALTREKPTSIAADYWALARTRFGWRIALARLKAPPDLRGFTQALLGWRDDDVIASAEDRARGACRFVATRNGRAQGLLIASTQPVAAARDFLVDGFDDAQPAFRLLAGGPAAQADRGGAICICHGVGAKEIEAAIARDAAPSVDSIGRATRAGTGCGSCRPEIHRLVKAAARHGATPAQAV
ncbi:MULTISPECIES: nitrate reductase [Methylosinus]|uniref:Nitrate reductase n=1 Tax=Methylosinus trichosporium (strain ATCC 35070 / NCIMB 11131 / UNIQEM 75 / OB3b) TaxID=595536 RepID=A0A2D2D4L1_METT3|nr:MULTISPECIES: nitrate reductase [Methylosinus]ATQ69789.1 nitrate reductase [Methylosinus trichosporium OB3b]OBS52412.1 nitrate reductase [Methylosinus sp. 3S-1]